MQGTYNERARIARQLETIEGRYEELSIRITLPEVISDTQLFTRLMREHSEMAELNQLAVDFRSLLTRVGEAKEMLFDPDMAQMAREELEELEPALEKMTREARIALLPKDPDDYKNALLEVRAGAGGDGDLPRRRRPRRRPARPFRGWVRTRLLAGLGDAEGDEGGNAGVRGAA